MDKLDYSILTRVFSRSVLNDFYTKSIPNNSIYKDAVNRFIPDHNEKTYTENFEELYSLLKNHYRNEYYYKNTLLNKLLLGVHSPNTTTALTELPIGESKADFILLNGKAIVYEIKTDLDNFDRLDSQIHNYYKAFNHVGIVASELNKNKLLSMYENSDVGIFIIKKNGSISTIKRPTTRNSGLSLSTIFAILRKQEYEELILSFYENLPQVNQFEYYECCRRLVTSLSIEQVYPIFLNLLKKRYAVENDIFFKLPDSLKFLGYFSSLNKIQYKKLEKNLNKKGGLQDLCTTQY